MQKKVLLLIACLGLAFQMQGCTSKDSKQGAEATNEYDSAELENPESGGKDSSGASVDSTAGTDQLPEDSLGAASSDIASSDTSSSSATTDLDTGAPSSSALETPIDSSNATDIMPPADSTSSASSSFADSSSSSAAAKEIMPSSSKPAVSLQKVASAPWQVGKVWANTVYFARPGDSLASVSQMIYGADKTSELKKINPTYKSRDLKPGDKVYYNSPQRAEDSSKIITYFEDTGVQPEVYVAKKGDNIRKVSKKLLGYDGAWKEVWASNSVESKSALTEGTELHYWKGSAMATVAPPASGQEVAAPQTTAGSSSRNSPPPVPEQQASADLPPPPPAPQDQLPPPPPDMAQNNAMPPPPPPADLNPPPPPPPHMTEEHKANEVAGGMDNDTTMALAVVGLGAAGLAILIVMRKKRKQKELEQTLNETHVGT